MTRSNLKPACCVIALALFAALTPAHARDRWSSHEQDRWSSRERGRWQMDERGPNTYAPPSSGERRISLEQAVARVQRATGGRVLDARGAGDNYRIKVLTRSGEVRVVYVDSRTGDMR
jgi:uncharacterized membrane protein YkoI